ncbi:iron reductase domain protein [Cadophora sp. DSE1049]|nr:iron reductase domain protein [Cadophora sp. DSE1049]
MKTSRLQQTLGWAVTGFASLSTAQFTFSPGPTYSIGIPSDSSISSSSTGPLYFHLEAPTSYQWVALGIGSQMAGASIFVMYADGNGNITLSGRRGTGQIEPRADSTLQAGLELLEGTGIANGMMVANVRCTSCTLDSDKTSSDSPWIAAWSIGSAIDSTSVSATIRQHSGNNRVEAQVDLSQASISSDANPFLSSSTPDSTSTGSSSPTTASSSKPTTGSGSNGYGNGGFGPGSNDDDDDDDDDADDGFRGNGNGNDNGGVTFGETSFQAITDYQKAHGIVMGVVVVLLFPFGAMFMRMGGSGIVHGILQVLSLCALLVGLGLGVRLANLRNMNLTTTHPLFGIIIVALFLIQPIFGLIHHIQYKRNLSRAGVSHLHIWYGRILILLAIINGGLGLKLANNSRNGEIAYGVVAGVVGAAYIAMCVFKRKGNGRGVGSGRGWRKEEVAGGSGGERHALPAYGETMAEGHYGAGRGRGETVVFK